MDIAGDFHDRVARLPRIGSHRSPASHASPGRAADALRLRLLLGQRGEEVVGMQWTEIDFKAKTWDLPGARTKNRRPHSVPLSSTSLGILERRRSEVPPDEPLVFPGLTAWTDDYRALSAIHGGAYEWKDFRRTVSTRLAARGFSEEVIGRALNHARYTVTARHYIKHAYLAETRQALDAWERTRRHHRWEGSRAGEGSAVSSLTECSAQAVPAFRIPLTIPAVARALAGSTI